MNKRQLVIKSVEGARAIEFINWHGIELNVPYEVTEKGVNFGGTLIDFYHLLTIPFLEIRTYGEY